MDVSSLLPNARTGQLSEEQKLNNKIQSKSSQLFPNITRLELTFYFVSFWSGALYSLYCFYRTSQRWGKYLYLSHHDDILHWRIDNTDMEWLVWPQVIISYLPWMILHTAVAQFIRKKNPKHLCTLYICSSMAVLVSLIGMMGTCLCLLVPVTMFVVMMTRMKTLIWITWCFILILFNTRYASWYLETWLTDYSDGDYKVSVIAAWIILRSLSYSLEVCESDPNGDLNPFPLLLTLLGYCLYFPCLCTGPYMPFVDFQAGLLEPYKEWTLGRLLRTALQLLRFFFWMAVCQLSLAFFFAHSFHYSPELVRKMSSWSMAGLSYFLIAFFMVKYVVLYGLCSVFARVEGYDPPRHPRCTLMTYRFSDVWRYFDHGLYKFMVKHIYVPWVGDDKSLVKSIQGSLLVFIFVYVWHGVSASVFWWSAINFVGIMTEKVVDSIAQLPVYKQWETKWLPGMWQRRFHALLAACLYVPSVSALVIFLSGVQNARTVAYKLFISGFPNCTLATLFFMYCLGQVSMELHNWQIRHKNKEQ